MSDDEITVVYDSRVNYLNGRRQSAHNSSKNFKVRKRIRDFKLKRSALNDDNLNNYDSKIIFNDFTEMIGSSKDEIKLAENIFHQSSNISQGDNICKIEITPSRNPKVQLVLSTSMDETKSVEYLESSVQLKKIKISTSKENFDYSGRSIAPSFSGIDEGYSNLFHLNNLNTQSFSSSTLKYPATSVVNEMQDLERSSNFKNDKLLPIITVNTSMSHDAKQESDVPTDKEILESSNHIQGKKILYLKNSASIYNCTNNFFAP